MNRLPPPDHRRPRTLNAAVSAALRPTLLAPARSARVVAAFRQAIYLEVVDTADSPPVVSLVTPAATAHPNSAIVAGEPDLPSIPAGAPARIGDGLLVLGDVRVTPTRWWSATVKVTGVRTAEVERRADQLDDALDRDGAAAPSLQRAVAELAAAVLAHDVVGACRAGRRLVGLGPGLTPAGDDALSGLFVATRVLGRGLGASGSAWPHPNHPAESCLAEVAEDLVAVSRTTTTSVSHALLWHAVRGHAAGPVAHLLATLGGRGSLHRSLAALLTVGSTSGRDLAIGIAAGARLAVGLASRPLAPSLSTSGGSAAPGRARRHLAAVTSVAPSTARRGR